jgi:hypothetical protein
MRKIFTENFSVSDVAEPLVSYDSTTEAGDVRSTMVEAGYDVVGVRKKGLVVGYVRREDLGDGLCGDPMHVFEEAEVVSDSVCFFTAVGLLSEKPRLFVTSFGEVGGIVTRSDLQKPPVRMWLFGMVTVIEMGFIRMIDTKYADGGWTQFLSEGRLDKAKALLEERKRRSQDLSLLDCLQFGDKGQIIVRDEELREQVGFRSRNRGEEVVKRLGALRDNLAHSQDIIASDWDSIVALSQNLDTVMQI